MSIQVASDIESASIQKWYGAPYRVDLLPVRQRIVQLTAENVDKKAGLQELARRIGISRFTFYRFLKGGQVSLATVKLICQRLDLEFAGIVQPVDRAA